MARGKSRGYMVRVHCPRCMRLTQALNERAGPLLIVHLNYTRKRCPLSLTRLHGPRA